MNSVSLLLPRIVRAVSLILILVLGGVVSCATMVSHESALDSLQNAQSCCDSIAHFKYEHLPEAEGVSFNLDASSNAFDFQSGKSYFKAFHLPKAALPYRIKITSWALGEHINKAHIFYPQVTLLDENFGIVTQSTPGDFVLSKAGFDETASATWGLPVKLEGAVLVDDPNAKFMLLYTTSALMRHASPYVARQAIPIIVPGMVTAIPGPEETMYIQHSPFGLVQMAFMPVNEKKP